MSEKLSIEKRLDLTEARINIISEGLNSILTEMVRLDNLAEEQKTAPVDLEKVKWIETQGPKGKFEKSEDFNNLEFKKLVKTLAEHDKKMTIDSYFVWLFENGSTVGRKKKSF